MQNYLIPLVMSIPLLVQCHPRGEVHDGIPPETWSQAVRIARPKMVAQDSDFTELALDEAGNAIAVWAHGVEEGTTIYAAHYRVGMGWEQPQPIQDRRRPVVADLQIATDTIGWRERDGPASHLYAASYTEEQGWATPVRLDQGTGEVQQVRLTSDGPDTRVAAWVTAHDHSHDIVVRAAHAGEWQLPVLIDTGIGSVVGLDLTSRNGRLVVVWSRWVETGYRIMVRRYGETSGWDTARPIDDGQGDALDPQVTVASDGSAISVWRQFDGSTYRLSAARYDPVTGWDAPETLGDGRDEVVYPDLTGDGKGTVFAAWLERRCEERRCVKSEAWVARYAPDNVGWSRPVQLASGAEGVKVAGDRRGRAIAVWAKSGAFGLPHIWTNSYDPIRGWGTPRPMNPDRRSSAHPAVAMNAEGAAVAVWEHFDLFSRRSLYAGWAPPPR